MIKKRRITSLLNILSGLGCLSISVVLLLELGFHLSVENRQLFSQIHSVIFAYYLVDIILRIFFSSKRRRYFITHPTDLFILLPYVKQLLPDTGIFSYFLLTQLSMLLLTIGRFSHITQVFRLLRLNPAQLLVGGFIFAIFTGSLILSLPIAVNPQIKLSFLDALFISTSAVCVTGLSTVDVPSVFSTFGQVVIITLVQIGGLGIMTFSALLSLLLNRKLSQRESRDFQESYAALSLDDAFRMTRAIIKYTILFEIIGGVLLYLAWFQDFDTIEQAGYYAAFHAVSAFCNAGFSLFSDSMIRYSDNIPVLSTISILIITGGLGFPVIFNLFNYNPKKNPFSRIRLQTKLSLYVTVILLILGTIIIYFGEQYRALAGMSGTEKALAAFFQSVAARTAGFNSVDLTAFSPGTLLVIMTLMFIGASPGSTGGGIKTTTFGILMMTFWSNLRAIDRVSIFKRTISQENIWKAFALVTLSVIIIVTFLYIILTLENTDFLTASFETVSAFGTVGLSLGFTPSLSKLGKVFIIILMLIGRVGPMTIAFALSRQKPTINYKYPEEGVLVV